MPIPLLSTVIILPRFHRSYMHISWSFANQPVPSRAAIPFKKGILVLECEGPDLAVLRIWSCTAVLTFFREMIPFNLNGTTTIDAPGDSWTLPPSFGKV